MQGKKVNLSIIFDVNLFNKIKVNNAEAIKKLISSKDCRVYTYSGSSDLVLFLVNDSSLIFRLLTNEGTLDNKRLINSSPEAIQWGREVFDYYLKNSTQITEI
jgi:predicted transcriptional regulator